VKLPPIKHVWLIVLADQSYSTLFGPNSTAQYLKTTLVPQGTLLSNYYATAHGALADGVALMSGQGPTPELQNDCPTYTNVTPGTLDNGTGQAHGHGCVFPTAVFTLPDQFTTNVLPWKAYIGGQANPVPGTAPTTCRHPVVGAADTTAGAAATADGYVTRRNPFVYFHSLIDTPACATTDVGLDQLGSDLTSGKVPAFSWIAPDLCSARAPGGCAAVTTVPTTTTSTTTIGPITLTTTETTTTTTTVSSGSGTSSSETTTSETSSGGSSTTTDPTGKLAAADTNPIDAFLANWVPKIQATAAYKKDGMIVILSDQAPASGPGADSSACCGKLSYPNTTNPGGTAKPGDGGGKTGALVLSTYAARGATDPTAADHYTLLRTLEDIFNLPYLGYANQRKDFSSNVFPSESGNDGAVSTRAGVHRRAGVARADAAARRRLARHRTTRHRAGASSATASFAIGDGPGPWRLP
jgi:hypothetical protein